MLSSDSVAMLESMVATRGDQVISAIAMHGARAYQYNKFKLTLAPNAILLALKTASA